MVKGPHPQAGVGRIVADQHVELVQRELSQKLVGVAVDARDPHVLTREVQRRGEQSMHDQLGKCVGHTDDESQATA